jgi:hypothetical protein
MTRFAVADVLGASVLVGDMRVGKVVGVYLDAGFARAIGLEVACTGGVRRFLPWAVASFAHGDVCASSALHLLDAAEGYERHGAVLLRDSSEIVGFSATRDGRMLSSRELVSAELGVGTSSA